MINFKRKSIMLVLTLSLMAGVIVPVETVAEASKVNQNESYTYEASEYLDYKSKIKDIYTGDTIQVDLNTASNETVEGVIKLDYKDSAKISINVPNAGHYNILVDYLIPNDKVLPTAIEVKVNGEFAYNELRSVTFNNLWKRSNETILDRYKNEIVPDILQVEGLQTTAILDGSGREKEALLIPLNAGENTIELYSIEGSIELHSLSLVAPESITLAKDSVGTIEGSEVILIEAETPSLQNSPSTRPGSWFNLDLTPYDNKLKKLNYIDGLSFKDARQFVEYEFEVETAGEYYLGLGYLQDAKVDFSVFVDISIDGEIISESFENYALPYTSNFQDTILKNQEGNLKVKLDKGTHNLRFQISIDPLQEILHEVEAITSEVQQLSITIKNLVGNVVDKNRNFEIIEYIPDVEDQLQGWSERLDELYSKAQEIQGTNKEIGAFAQLQIASKQLKSIGSKRREIHIRVNELSTGTNSVTAYLGTFLEGMNNNGLSIDKFFFIQDSKDTPKKAGFIKKTIDGTVRFFGSFGKQNYTANDKNSDNLQVWVNRPRQYVEILQNIIDKDFTPKTGIKVDLSIMPDPNKLILANASGNAPDVALGVNYALPFDLAIRNAILDLTQFEDFNEVASQFPEQLHVPAMIENGVYAMPETMNFYVMFYRKDILDDIGIEPFDTMEEVVTTLPILHQQGLNFFYPTAGMAAMKIFAGTMPIVYQNGGNFYSDTITRTNLNSKETIDGFKKLTDLFTIYNMPYDVPSFYQQFRDGSLPVGIADYGAYNLLTNAAPEIANLWDIAPMPGYVDENGEVQRHSSGGAESSIIFSDTDKKDASWEFMKWWSSSDVQTEFGTTLQTSFGKEYMWNTANTEAFTNLPWKAQHKETIIEQSEWIVEVPRVLGTYMLERELSNAYNAVVLEGQDLRRAIDLATKRINRETNRKLEEFGYIKDGVLIKEYHTPNMNIGGQ